MYSGYTMVLKSYAQKGRIYLIIGVSCNSIHYLVNSSVQKFHLGFLHANYQKLGQEKNTNIDYDSSSAYHATFAISTRNDYERNHVS